ARPRRPRRAPRGGVRANRRSTGNAGRGTRLPAGTAGLDDRELRARILAPCPRCANARHSPRALPPRAADLAVERATVSVAREPFHTPVGISARLGGGSSGNAALANMGPLQSRRRRALSPERGDAGRDATA